MKKALFHVLGISMSLISGLLAAEIVLRVRDERLRNPSNWISSSLRRQALR